MLQNKHGKRNDPNYTGHILSEEEIIKKSFHKSYQNQGYTDG